VCGPVFDDLIHFMLKMVRALKNSTPSDFVVCKRIYAVISFLSSLVREQVRAGVPARKNENAAL
jgi:hypothetical protein